MFSILLRLPCCLALFIQLQHCQNMHTSNQCQHTTYSRLNLISFSRKYVPIYIYIDPRRSENKMGTHTAWPLLNTAVSYILPAIIIKLLTGYVLTISHCKVNSEKGNQSHPVSTEQLLLFAGGQTKLSGQLQAHKHARLIIGILYSLTSKHCFMTRYIFSLIYPHPFYVQKWC